MTDPGAASLTRTEAEERARLLRVSTYDLEVDLHGLLEGEAWVSTARIAFTCTEPGAATFVDAVGEIESATLNGRDLDLTGADAPHRGRLPLTGLAADNELVVRLRQTDTARGAGILRSVDPTDKRVYVWSSFEPDDARRAWACFDQPDLKAVHRITAHVPSDWVALSNSAPAAVERHDDPLHPGSTWVFEPTPPLSTYVAVLNAGPFHEVRSERGGHSLGLWCRQSLAEHLERDAEFLFRLTEQGLAWFGERFGSPFPQHRYDQVFVPGMGGAMENWGCITWTDSVIWRQPPTESERDLVAMVLLHEMAHQWFGDLVTLRWWDDLWLNEAFASWASTWAQVGATEHTHAWASFALDRQPLAYRLDDGPASHAIRGPVETVSEAMATFDAITYSKGEAVLRQLAAYVGEEAFAGGLAAYFAAHAWGNATFDDLVEEIGRAAGLDLRPWAAEWFDRAGHDRLTLAGDALRAEAGDGLPPRSHRLDIGVYDATESPWRRLARVPVTTHGESTPVDLGGAGHGAGHGAGQGADLHLVNDGGWTFASVRTDTPARLLAAAGGAPDVDARAMVATTAWDLLVRGEAATGDVLDALLAVAEAEDHAGLLEPLLGLARQAAWHWSHPDTVADRVGSLAALAVRRLDAGAAPEVAAELRRTLAANATTPEQVARAVAEAEAAPGATGTDLAWRLLVRRAQLGEDVVAEARALRERDPDPDARPRELAVLAGVPGRRAEAWQAVEDDEVQAGLGAGFTLAEAVWDVAAVEETAPLAQRWLDLVRGLDDGGMMQQAGRLRMLTPRAVPEGFAERAEALAAEPGVHPTGRQYLLLAADTARRMQRARATR